MSDARPRPEGYSNLLAWPPPDDCTGLVRVEDTREGSSRYACIKCGTQSGNDYSQCQGFCPVEQSPHYSAKCLEKYLAKRA